MSKQYTTQVLAKMMDWNLAYLRQIMWNHGFDPAVDWRGEVWSFADFQQMVAERVRWGFLVDLGSGQFERDTAQIKRKRCRVDPAAKYDPPSSVTPVVMSETERAAYRAFQDKCAAHERYNQRLREQLKSAPVLAQDLDYLASRAGERRKRGDTSGVTTLILQRERNK